MPLTPELKAKFERHVAPAEGTSAAEAQATAQAAATEAAKPRRGRPPKAATPPAAEAPAIPEEGVAVAVETLSSDPSEAVLQLAEALREAREKREALDVEIVDLLRMIAAAAS